MDNMDIPDLQAIGNDLRRFEEDETVKDALSKGVDLRTYWATTEDAVRKLRESSVEDYTSEEVMRTAASLHADFNRCEKMLTTAEAMIVGFQDQLGDVSEEMRILHEKCSSVRHKVENRERVLKHLTRFLGKVAVSNEMKDVIERGAMNDAFVAQLQRLNAKIEFVRGEEGGDEDDKIEKKFTSLTRAAHNVAPQLERLRNTAVKHVREYLLGTIQSMRRAKAPVQRIQRDSLQRFAEFPKFLKRHAPTAYAEVEDMYIATIRKVHAQTIRTYHDDLARMTGEMCTKLDMIVVNEQGRLSIFSGRQKVQRTNESLGLNDRHLKLARLEQTKPGWRDVAQVKAEARKAGKAKILMIETSFRSVVARASDVLTFEFLFLEHFFGRQRQLAIFRQVAGGALDAHVHAVETAVARSYDVIGLLLLLHTSRRAASGDDHGLDTMAKALREMYYEKMDKVIIARVNAVVAENADTMRNVDMRRIGAVTLHAHVSSLRFAKLATAVNAVTAWSGEIMDTSKTCLATLCDSMRVLLGHLAESAHRTKSDRAVFLTNNIDVILATFREGGVEISWAEEMQKLMERQVFSYIDELLQSKFGRLIAFVRCVVEKKEVSSSSSSSSMGVKLTDMPSIALEFAKTYKQSIKHIDSVVIQSFQNAMLAVTVSKRLFTVLLQTYPKFHSFVKTRFPTGTRDRPSWIVSMVGTGAVMVEVKRYHRLL